MISVSRVATLPAAGTSARVVAALSSRTRRAWPPAAVALATPPGAVTLTGAAAGPAPRVLTLAAGHSLTDDYYQRTHIRPRRLALGALVGEQMRQVEVWSAFFAAHLLSAVVSEAADGVELAGPPAPPTTWGPLESRTYDVRIGTQGPSRIDGALRWDFAAGPARLYLTGQRVVTFAYPPHWDSGLDESLEWLTVVDRARSGREQRRALRDPQRPRRGLRYTAWARGADAAHLRHLLHAWQDRLFALPVWTDAALLAAPLGAGATGVACDTVGRGFRPGALAVLCTSPRSAEAVEIATVTSGALTWARPTAQSWPAGTRLAPAELARLPAGVTLAQVGLDLLTADLTWACEGAELPAAADGATVYRGLPVLDARPTRSVPGEDGVERRITVIDAETNAPWVVTPDGQPDPTHRHTWSIRSRAERAAWRAWLVARAGQLTACWLPGQTVDFVLARSHAAGETAIDVLDTGYAALVAGGTAWERRRDLIIETVTGTRLLRRITAAEALPGGQERLALDAALGVDLAVADVRAVSFLHRVRLAADRIEIHWINGEIGRVELPLRGVLA